jgi:hypothetical protein
LEWRFVDAGVAGVFILFVPRMSCEGRSYLISATGGDAMSHRFKIRYSTRLEVLSWLFSNGRRFEKSLESHS